MSLATQTDPVTTTHSSACPLDCPDACGLTVRVEDGRVTKLDADQRNPYSLGTICSKVRAFPEHMYGPDRVLHPLRRVASSGAKGSGEFERISWDQALGEIAQRLLEARRRSGGESILPYSYGGSNGALSQGTTDELLFRRLSASRLLHTVCAAPSGRAATGLYGKMCGVALSDYVHSKLIVVWGTNPAATGIHLIPVLEEAKRRGAQLVVVDPLRTATAKRADLHLAPRPGTDLVVALAIHRHLFETGQADIAFLENNSHGWQTLRDRATEWTFDRAAEVSGVPARDIEALAVLYAESQPAVIRSGWGMERNRNGGSAIAAVIALPAVGGKFGVLGGGYTMSNSGVWKLSDPLREPEAATRQVNMNLLGEALAARERPVEVLFVYNSNALATTPNQTLVRAGLEREDLFTVVFDQVMTDTARYADIVLPATTFLEHDELSKGYGALVMHRSKPVVPAVGEARPNLEVFGELLRRVGMARPEDPVDAAGFVDRLLPDADRRAAIERDGTIGAPVGEHPIQFQTVFPYTADQKIHLAPEALDRESPVGIYGYRENPQLADGPLSLLSPATNRRISSTLGQRVREPARVEMAAEDAQRYGVTSGQPVAVWNRLGRVEVEARVSPDVPPGVVVLVKGLWAKDTLNGWTANALAPDSLSDLGAGACFNDARVSVTPL